MQSDGRRGPSGYRLTTASRLPPPRYILLGTMLIKRIQNWWKRRQEIAEEKRITNSWDEYRAAKGHTLVELVNSKDEGKGRGGK